VLFLKLDKKSSKWPCPYSRSRGERLLMKRWSFMGIENIGCVMNVPINCGQLTASPDSHVKNCYYSEISSSTCSVSRQIAGKEPKRTLAKKKEKISNCSASKEIARKKLSTFMHKICCRMMQLFGRGIPIYLF